MSPDSVTLETVVVRFPIEYAADIDQLWLQVDESIIDLEHRLHLDKNGLRAGVLMGELPVIIREQLHRTAAAQTTDAIEYAGLAADADNRMRQLSCRAGRRKELVLRRDILEPLTVISTRSGRLSGEIFLGATAQFDLRVVPHENGTATIKLVPEVQHGEYRHAYVSSQMGVRPDLRRQQTTWRDLAIEAKLEPQRILMVACTQPPKALGRALFMTRTVEQTEEYLVLLIRLSKTQLDELFAPELIEQARALTEQ
jgi:hypothetical protein